MPQRERRRRGHTGEVEPGLQTGSQPGQPPLAIAIVHEPAIMRVSVTRQLPEERAEQLLEHHRGRREAEFRTLCALEPGEHTFLVHRPNQPPHEVKVQVKPGEDTPVRVTLEEAGDPR